MTLENLSDSEFQSITPDASQQVLGGMIATQPGYTQAGWDLIDGKLYPAYVADY